MDTTMDRTDVSVGQYAEIRIDQLMESPHNPRRHFDERKLLELGESIQEKGIVEPLVVRRNGHLKNGMVAFEIVAGARRYRAAKMADLQTVPCVVRDYSDEDVLELFLIENVQRDDLAPLEQARGFKQLLEANRDKYSVGTIATKVGMSPAWVWDRLKLLDLVPEAQALLEQGRITIGHAIVLARHKPEDQARIIDPTADALFTGESTRDLLGDEDDEDERPDDPWNGMKPVSIRELEGWIAHHVRFDVKHAAKAQPLVFDELARQVEQTQAQPGRGKKVIPITFEYTLADSAKDPDERTYSLKSWRRADGSEQGPACDHSVLGVVVAGAYQGKSFRVCIARDTCRVHFGQEIAAKEKAEAARKKGDTKTAKKVETRQEERWERQERERRERKAIWEPMKPAILAAAYDQVKTREALTPQQVKFFTDQGQFTIGVQVAQDVLGKRWFETLAAAALVSAIEDFWGDSFDEFVKNVAVPLGLSLKPLEKARDAHLATLAPPTAAAPAKTARGRK